MSSKNKWALCVTAFFLATGLWSPPLAEEQEVESKVFVVDGDTLEIDGSVFRLFGVDAPELGQTCLDKSKRWRCGLQAALEMRSLFRIWGSIECYVIHTERNEVRAICHDPQYNDPAEVLLTRGLAIALPESIPAYKRAEKQAKRAKLGLWRGEFVLPSEWRAGKRLPGPADSPAEVCDVKGIVTEEGHRVYYVPTDKDYDGLTVTAARGERYFCSDDEAELAGWKRYPRP